jgi:NADPH-dependent 2,4-dienoyl-CoA reductase/sulfur reductase-like enzyme
VDRRKKAQRAILIGAGFIGLEMAENLVHRGLGVTVVELLDQVMPPLDPEMAAPVRQQLEKNGVSVALGNGVAGFDSGPDGAIVVNTKSGAKHTGDMVILAIGVRPETRLAKTAGLDNGERGGIRVDDQMRTSDTHIWAVGDAIETHDVIIGQPTVIPLAGPANRQGRVAADAINGRPTKFRGIQGTSVCGAFGLTVASTGASVKGLRRAGITDFEKIYLHPGHHVSYFPGEKPITIKLLFRKSDGRVLGAQAIGEAGVERRIDIIATAI